jgi:hypothetical protein
MSALVVNCDGDPVGGDDGGGVAGGGVDGGGVDGGGVVDGGVEGGGVDVGGDVAAPVLTFEKTAVDNDQLLWPLTASPAYTLAPIAIVTLLPCCRQLCPSADT